MHVASKNRRHVVGSKKLMDRIRFRDPVCREIVLKMSADKPQ